MRNAISVMALVVAFSNIAFAQSFEFESDGRNVTVVGKGTMVNPTTGIGTGTTFRQEMILECTGAESYIRSDSSFHRFGSAGKLTLNEQRHSIVLVLDNPPTGIISCDLYGSAITTTAHGQSVNFTVYGPQFSVY